MTKCDYCSKMTYMDMWSCQWPDCLHCFTIGACMYFQTGHCLFVSIHCDCTIPTTTLPYVYMHVPLMGLPCDVVCFVTGTDTVVCNFFLSLG